MESRTILSNQLIFINGIEIADKLERVYINRQLIKDIQAPSLSFINQPGGEVASFV